MGNTKDFILKNAIEVGADTKVTLGTITSGTVDLSTGNYFAETLAANTTYTFSNPGDVQSFQLEVTGNDIVNGYDLSVASYDSVSFSVSAQETAPTSVFFKPDGTKMYILGSFGDDVNEYNLSTAWDISTASYVQNFSVAAQDTAPQDIFFKSDGTKMYVVGSTGDAVYEYNLSTAWNVSTISYLQNFSVSAQDTAPSGLFFKPDGLKMYVIGNSGDAVYEYNLSTAWDISTASYVQSFSVSAQENQPAGIFFKPDGLKMYTTGETFQASVDEYSLSTAWDISTASYSQNFSVNSQEQFPTGVFFKPDGVKMYVVGYGSDTVYQYTTGTISTATITWPASVEWPAGVSPITPAAGETDIFTFVTDDGGTTYIGLHTADNLS